MRSHSRFQALVVGAVLAASLLFTSSTVAGDRSARTRPADSGAQARSTAAISSRSSATSITHRAARQLLQLRLFRFLHEGGWSLLPGLSDDPDPTSTRDDPPVLDKVPPKLKQRPNLVGLN